MAAQYLARATGLPRSFVSLPARLIVALVERATGLPLSRLDPLLAARRIACPAVVVHGEADALVPVSFARPVFAALGGEKELWIVPRAGHEHHADEPSGLHAAAYYAPLGGLLQEVSGGFRRRGDAVAPACRNPRANDGHGSDQPDHEREEREAVKPSPGAPERVRRGKRVEEGPGLRAEGHHLGGDQVERDERRHGGDGEEPERDRPRRAGPTAGSGSGEPPQREAGPTAASDATSSASRSARFTTPPSARVGARPEDDSGPGGEERERARPERREEEIDAEERRRPPAAVHASGTHSGVTRDGRSPAS